MADEKELFPSALCSCSQKSVDHVHCPCNNCNGKAVNRRTQLNHIRLQEEIKKLSTLESDSSACSHTDQDARYQDVEMNSSKTGEGYFSVQSDELDSSNADEDGMEICTGEDQELSNLQINEYDSVHCVGASYTEHPSEHMACLNAEPTISEESDELSDQDEPPREQITKDAIINAIFQSLDCIDKMGGSLNNFADLLTMARVLYCKGARLDPDDQDVVKEWPKGWSDAKKVLADVGYTDAKEYFICLNDAHPCHWDILESSNDVCVLLRDMTRKVMLYPYRPGLFAVIDPARTTMPLPHILVPVYPQISDMVLVKGDDDELWRAEIRAVDHRLKSARGYFFVKHRNWNDNQLWVRESLARAMDTILYKSIVGLVEGQWHGSCWKDS